MHELFIKKNITSYYSRLPPPISHQISIERLTTHRNYGGFGLVNLDIKFKARRAAQIFYLFEEHIDWPLTSLRSWLQSKINYRIDSAFRGMYQIPPTHAPTQETSRKMAPLQTIIPWYEILLHDSIKIHDRIHTQESIFEWLDIPTPYKEWLAAWRQLTVQTDSPLIVLSGNEGYGIEKGFITLTDKEYKHFLSHPVPESVRKRIRLKIEPNMEVTRYSFKGLARRTSLLLKNYQNSRTGNVADTYMDWQLFWDQMNNFPIEISHQTQYFKMFHLVSL